MYWQYRIVNMPSQNGGEDWYQLQEVYFNNDGSLMGHSDPSTGTEDLDGLKQLGEWIDDAFKQPIIHEANFPKEESNAGDISGYIVQRGK